MEELVKAEIAEDIAETEAIAVMRADFEASIAELKREARDEQARLQTDLQSTVETSSASIAEK